MHSFVSSTSSALTPNGTSFKALHYINICLCFLPLGTYPSHPRLYSVPQKTTTMYVKFTTHHLSLLTHHLSDHARRCRPLPPIDHGEGGRIQRMDHIQR